MLQPVHWTLLMTLLIGLCTATTNTVITPFLDWAGYSLPAVGALVSLRGIASLAARLPGGLLYRPATARWATAGSCILLAASTMAYIFTHAPVWVISMRVVQGATWGVASTLNLAMFYDAVPDSTLRGRLIATQGLAEVVGQSIGNFAGGLLMDWLGYSATFTLSGVTALLAATCALPLPRVLGTGLPPGRVTGGPARSGVRAPVTGAAAARGEEAPSRLTWRERWVLLARPGVLLPGASYMSHRFIAQFLNAYFPLWAVEAGLNYTFVGTFRGMQSLAGLVGRPVAGEATRLFQTNTLVIGGLVLSAISVMVVPSTTSTVLLLAIAAAGSLTRSASQVGMRVQLYEGTESQPETRGIATGLFMAGGDLGLILGPLTGGLFAGALGLTAALQLVPALSAAPILALMVLMRRQARRA